MIPSWKSALLAVLAAVLLILSFPDFEFWFLAWIALVPLMWGVEREKASAFRSFVLGWLFGTIFFFGTCWWLTFAPITYAGFPPLLAYFLLLCVTIVAGLFPAAFATILAVLLRRFGPLAFLAAPFVWVATEFARYWITGNNWNAVAYSQGFSGRSLGPTSVGGIWLMSFIVLAPGSLALALSFAWKALKGNKEVDAALGAVFTKPLTLAQIAPESVDQKAAIYYVVVVLIWAASSVLVFYLVGGWPNTGTPLEPYRAVSRVIAIQPNVPMSGLNSQEWQHLRSRQIEMAEAELQKLRTTNNDLPTTVILPESPMNFMYNDDREFQQFIGDFARRNNVSVLFNSAEPDPSNGKYFNSAVLVGPDGKKAEQYDKIYLLPFGEAVPLPLQNIVPAFVGTFSYGSEYDLVPLGEAKAGIMICFESHFGELSREYVRNGADAIIEMTNDGYLGPTPVLRQHLANAVFRAVEANRPVLRVTNVGITAYIDEHGAVIDPLPSYQEGTRVWTVSKSDGSQTFYVKYGDWFAWLCVLVTAALLSVALIKKREDIAETRTQ